MEENMTAKSQKLTKHNLKKSLGQNFLRDPKILKKIADFAKIDKNDTIIEIGPGEGTLTKFLLERAGKVIAIEKDERMVEHLHYKFQNQILLDKLKIISGDVLKIENLLKIAKLKIESFILVGNVPYYITGALFRKIFELENLPKSLTFVVQKEVVDRIMTRDKKESILSISLKVYGTPKYGGVIKAGSFFPKPKVDSAIISIEDISRKNLKKKDEEIFFEILKAGFAHKRKLLIKNLSEISSKSNLEKVFDTLNIPKNTRAEDLKVENWLQIARRLKDTK
jgi:16S rRNA (adenine1518-N6/adenine1519-N6)-dimethyltransferase